MEDLYREQILDHYKNPRNWGELDDADLEFEDTNPLCGDELKVQLRVEDGKVATVAFSSLPLPPRSPGRLREGRDPSGSP